MKAWTALLVVIALAAPAAAQPLEGTVSSVKNDNGKHLHLSWSREPGDGKKLLILRRPADVEATPLPTIYSGDKLAAPNEQIGAWTVAFTGDGATEFTDEVEPGKAYVYAFLEGTEHKASEISDQNRALIELRFCLAVHALRAREAAESGGDPGNAGRHLYREEGLPCEKETRGLVERTALPQAVRDQIAAWRGDADVVARQARDAAWPNLKPSLASLEARRKAIDVAPLDRILDKWMEADPFIAVVREVDEGLWQLVGNDADAATARQVLTDLAAVLDKAPAEVKAATGGLAEVARLKDAAELDPIEVAWKLFEARPAKLPSYWTLEHLADSQPVEPVPSVYNTDRTFYLLLVALTVAAFLLYLGYARRRAKSIFIRRMPGVDAIEDAIGRSTEMGRPVLYVTGIEEIQDIQTLASVLILGHVATLTADYDTEIKVCNTYPMTMVVAEEVVRQGYANAGRLDAHKPENVMFITSEQFAFAAAVNGMILRDRPATNIYFGRFFAESLMLAETGYLTGSVQIAGTAEFSQLPFFVAACDYTLLGEELYAVGAYLSREPTLLAQLKAGDVVKAFAMLLIFVGMLLATFEIFQLGPWLMP